MVLKILARLDLFVRTKNAERVDGWKRLHPDCGFPRLDPRFRFREIATAKGSPTVSIWPPVIFRQNHTQQRIRSRNKIKRILTVKCKSNDNYYEILSLTYFISEFALLQRKKSFF